jgi:putative FmdB family regulatory protein
MPIYEYECTECQHRTELLQRHGDPPLESCPECGGRVRKLFSAPAVQFKGSGWYVTDYAGKGKRSSEAGKAEGDGAAEGAKKKEEAAPSGESKAGKSAGSE